MWRKNENGPDTWIQKKNTRPIKKARTPMSHIPQAAKVNVNQWDSDLVIIEFHRFRYRLFSFFEITFWTFFFKFHLYRIVPVLTVCEMIFIKYCIQPCNTKKLFWPCHAHFKKHWKKSHVYDTEIPCSFAVISMFNAFNTKSGSKQHVNAKTWRLRYLSTEFQYRKRVIFSSEPISSASLVLVAYIRLPETHPNVI